VALVVVAIITIFGGIYFDGNVVEVWKTLGGLSAASLLFPLILAQFFPGRISDSSFCWAVIASCLGIVSCKVIQHYDPNFAVEEFYIGILLTSCVLIPALFRKS
jgi:hypothetical protein